MTTELTLREKVREALSRNAGYGNLGDAYACDLTMDIVATALEATGAPAYIRVADDLRGVVREELDHDKLEFWPRHLAASADLYLNRMNETGGESE